MYRVIVFVLFLVEVLAVKGQVSEYTQNFSIWSEGRSLINPASSGKTGNSSIQLAYAGYSGLRKNIKTIYGAGFFKIGTQDEKKMYQSLGLGVYSDQPGKYTRKNRSHLYYAVHLPISENFIFSSGIAVGAYNYFITDNPSEVSVSAFAPDGNIGLILTYKEHTEFGLAAHQFIGNTFRPLETDIRLEQNYILSIQHQQEFEASEIDLGGYYRVLNNVYYKEYNLYGVYGYKVSEIVVYGGVIYKGELGSDLMVMAKSKLSLGELKVGFSYNVITSSHLNGNAQYQISINYLIP